MRRTIVGAMVSIDGVMQAPGGPTEDPIKGFKRGGCVTPYGWAPHSFKLMRSRVCPNGVIVGHYEREVEPNIGDIALDSPSGREIARRERMQREGKRVADVVDPVSTTSAVEP